MNDPAEYARQVESYLCQKNRGHLIRVVGPAFEMVSGWASTGVPLKVALRGIERCCERLQSKGPRRRPIRVEFCEADVLDAFQDWRRAVGVGGGGGAGDAESETSARKPPLAAHIERVIARLAHARGVGPPSTSLHQDIDRIVRELEMLASPAAGARGEARATIVERLAELDAQLMSAALAAVEVARSRQLRAEAAAELAPFGARMPSDAKDRALEAAFERLVREAGGLPTIGYE